MYYISKGTLVIRKKFVPKKSLKTKGLDFESVSNFMVWITLPSTYVGQILSYRRGPQFGKPAAVRL